MGLAVSFGMAIMACASLGVMIFYSPNVNPARSTKTRVSKLSRYLNIDDACVSPEWGGSERRRHLDYHGAGMPNDSGAGRLIFKCEVLHDKIIRYMPNRGADGKLPH